MQLQKEFDEMTDTDNNPFGRFTPDPNSANKNRLIKEHLIFTEIPEPASNRIAQFNDLNSPPWVSKQLLGHPSIRQSQSQNSMALVILDNSS